MTDVELQNRKLKELLAYLAEHSPFYQRVFKRNQLNVDNVNCAEDLSKIPFTAKEDLQEHTADFICVPRNKLADYITTSGTTGKPVTLASTAADLERLALNEYTSFVTAGVTSEDVIQLMTTMDRRFMAGLAYFLGAQKLGAGFARVGNGIPELQWDTIRDIRPSVIICVPSFILRLIEFADANGIDFKNSSVKKAICIGEAIRNPDFTLNTLGQKIAQKWDIQLYSTYASSEMATAFTECDAFAGGHLQPELLIAEIIGEDDRPVKDGQAGELVITTLGIEGMPLLRFKTGDICIAHSQACICGRKSLRLSPILGRKKQMIKYKGTSLYPTALYDILEGIEAVQNYQVEVATNDMGTDEITINIGIQNHARSGDLGIGDVFRAKLRVVPKLVFLSPSEVTRLLLPENSRKPLKFIDKRRGY